MTHSVSLYLLVGSFSPFMFKAIIGIYVPIGFPSGSVVNYLPAKQEMQV